MSSEEPATQANYSRWLMPTNPRVVPLYKEYTRSQVRRVTRTAWFFMLVTIVISFFISYYLGEFQLLTTVGYRPNLCYFFMTCGLLVVTVGCTILSRKWSVWSELVIPIYTLILCAFCIPFWTRPLGEPTDIKTQEAWQATLIATNLVNLFLATFYTSNYALSVTSRSLIYLQYLNIGLRLFVW